MRAATAAHRIPRRDFLAAALAAAWAARTAHPAPRTPPVCIFSKHLPALDLQALAKTCREIGADGIDLTVRPGGHVLPENVGRDLPAAVEAARAEGIAISMITTRLQSDRDPHARTILETAAGLGIGYARISGHRYTETPNPVDQLGKVAEDVRGLAALAESANMTLGYHNHSGWPDIGAPLWDLHRVITEVNSPRVGSNLDLGHTTVEGTYGGWQVNTRLLAPHVKMASVKDFVWEGDHPRWVPLGTGIVKTAEMLRLLRTSGFAGPISIHVEYRVDNEEVMVEEMREAVVTLRNTLIDAGYG